MKELIYRLADFYFELNRKYNSLGVYSKDYETTTCKFDATFSISENELKAEAKMSNEKVSNGMLEMAAMHRKIAEWLPGHNAFVLHSACFDVDGVGVAFAAHSGTGKSTHMIKWQEFLGDKMTVVNGDKPIVRFFDDEPETPYAYGTPWNGKEKLGCNMRTPLKHICFIERSATNFVEKMDKSDAINRIFNQVYKPKDPVAVMNTMSLIDRLLSCCNLWIIHCNMEDDAAETAYNAIFNS